MSYIYGYKENLKECKNENIRKFGKCEYECNQDFFKHHQSPTKLADCLDGCVEALNNSDCIKVSSQHHYCHRWCEDNYQGVISRPGCKVECNREYASFGDTKDTLGDSYSLADSVSVV